MKNNKPISEQVEYEDLPDMDEFDVEPEAGIGVLEYAIVSIMIAAILWMVVA